MFYFTHILCVMLAVHVLLVLYTFCVMLTASFVMLTARVLMVLHSFVCDVDCKFCWSCTCLCVMLTVHVLMVLYTFCV